MANAITVLALTTFLLLLITKCGQSIGSDVRQYNPEFDCTRCDLRGVDLTDAYLEGADLAGADLTGAGLTNANLTGADLSDSGLSGVYGADFRGAMNVPAEYLKP